MALTDGLVSYWKLDETSGTRYDSHGTNHLTDRNTVGYTTGKIGNAAQFTVADVDNLTIGDNASLSVGDIDFTVALWTMKASATGAGPLAEKKVYAATGNTTAWALWVKDAQNSNYLTFTVGNGSEHTHVGNAAYNADGNWHLIVAWHDATADTINLQSDNGSIVSASCAHGSQDEGGPFNIGGMVGGYCTGAAIDCVGFWKRVLTEAERTTLYGAGTPPEYPWVPGGNPFIIRAPIPSWCH